MNLSNNFKILVYDQDLTKNCMNLNDIVISKSYGSSDFYISESTINLINTNKFWDLNGNFLSKRDWFQKIPIEIYYKNILIWDGKVTNIKNDNQDNYAEFTTTNSSFLLFQKSINYSNTGVTPIQVLKDLCILGNINYDEVSFNNLENLFATNSFLVNVYFNSETNFNLSSAMSEVINRCGLYGYFFNNKFYISVLGDTFPKIKIPKSHVFSNSDFYDYELLNNYEITWLFGTEKDENNNNIGRNSRDNYGEFNYSQDGASGSSIEFTTKAGVVFLGELIIKNNLKPRSKKIIKIPNDYYQIINMNKYIEYDEQIYEINNFSLAINSYYIELELTKII